MTAVQPPPSSSHATRPLTLPPTSHRPAPYDGPSKEEVLAVRQQYVSPGIMRYYRDPLMLVEGNMQ
ncbi:MAG: hypothetical protein WD066_08810, partial [Planctomycetaceae bacterium]